MSFMLLLYHPQGTPAPIGQEAVWPHSKHVWYGEGTTSCPVEMHNSCSQSCSSQLQHWAVMASCWIMKIKHACKLWLSIHTEQQIYLKWMNMYETWRRLHSNFWIWKKFLPLQLGHIPRFLFYIWHITWNVSLN